MTGILYSSLPSAEGSLCYTDINQGHSLRSKSEENTAGAEDSKTSSLGLKKAVLVKRKEAIIFSIQQTDKALLQCW